MPQPPEKWTIHIQGGPDIQQLRLALFETNEKNIDQEFPLIFTPRNKPFMFRNVEPIMQLEIKVHSVRRILVDRSDIVFLIIGLVDSDDWERWKPETPLMATITYSAKTQKGIAELLMDERQLKAYVQASMNLLNGLYADEF